ncbi:RnfABCDGE type electron transport complex subunit D [Candidatus Woesearchaeota archaeon]|nr:RnfABCDGE type electron transport complex subunit D [Candidatus Woesearchaeota archaeon]
MKFPFTITFKTYIGIILFILTIIGIIKNGVLQTIPQLIITIATTIILDVSINYIKEKEFILPDSATISALFIATALSINQVWYIPITAGAIGILSKHIIKIKEKHIFNPAVFGLFVVILLFDVKIEWWASQITWLVIILGLFISYKVKRFHITIPYFLTSIIISLIYNLIAKNPITIGNLLFSTNLFFMFFILVEPMTAPTNNKGKIIYGILAAIFSFLILIFIPRFEPSIFALVITDLSVPLLNKLES